MKMILFELGNITIQGMLLIPSGKNTKNYGTSSPFIVDFPTKNGGSFIVLLYVYQRVSEVFDFDYFDSEKKTSSRLSAWDPTHRATEAFHGG